MGKTERLLRICADTLKMPGWRDALSIITDRYSANELSDDLLDDVAGGITNPDLNKNGAGHHITEQPQKSE